MAVGVIVTKRLPDDSLTEASTFKFQCNRTSKFGVYMWNARNVRACKPEGQYYLKPQNVTQLRIRWDGTAGDLIDLIKI